MASADAKRMACYILTADREREDLIDELKDVMGNRSIKRKAARNHIFWTAVKAFYGMNEAEKIITQVIEESCFDQDEGRSYYRRVLGEEAYRISRREFVKRKLREENAKVENTQNMDKKITLQREWGAGSADHPIKS